MTHRNFAGPRALRPDPILPSSMPFFLLKEGTGGDDILSMKRDLNRLGFYRPDAATGLDVAPDMRFFDSLRAFQRVHMVPPDDRAGPGSVTERILAREIAMQDDESFYIWHSVGDEKVRGEHAARNGRTFSWNNPPEGGHPGEDYNCRCWAELVVKPRHPLVEELYAKEELYPDAINPTWSPFDFLLLSGMGARAIGKGATGLSIKLAAKARDVGWIRNASISKIQHMYKEADKFGINGNPNRKTLAEFRQALIEHAKSPNTQIVKGSYHGKKPRTIIIQRQK